LNSFDDMGGRKVLWGLLVVWIGLLYMAHSMESAMGPGNDGVERMLPSGPQKGPHPHGKGRSPQQGGIVPPHFQPTASGR
jgi:hypothetical protein